MTAELTKEQRDHILDKIDEILGIRIDPATLPGAHKWGPQPPQASARDHTDAVIPPDSAKVSTQEHTEPELPAPVVPESAIVNPQPAIQPARSSRGPLKPASNQIDHSRAQSHMKTVVDIPFAG